MANHKLTETITQINSSTKNNGISVSRLFKLIGKRSHYVLSFLSFLLVLLPIPMPPGFVLILSIPALFITAQILYGVDVVVIPKFILNIKVSKFIIRKIDLFSRKYLFKVEALTRRRFSLLTSQRTKKIHNIVLFMCAIGCAMPIPFVCMIPATAGALISAGLIIEDGLLIIVGWVVDVIAYSIIWGTIKAFISIKDYIAF